MQLHLSLILLKLLVRRRSRIDPAVSGNAGEDTTNMILLQVENTSGAFATLSKAVFCWQGSAGGAGWGATMFRPALTFGT